MSRVLKNYCTECEWVVEGAEHPVNERTRLAIDHAVTTGHDIDCVHRPDVSSDKQSPWVVRDTR